VLYRIINDATSLATISGHKLAPHRPPHRRLLNDKPGHTETLTQRFSRASREELRELATAVGPAVLWDELILPVL
jgi:hypothetical protein